MKIEVTQEEIVVLRAYVEADSLEEAMEMALNEEIPWRDWETLEDTREPVSYPSLECYYRDEETDQEYTLREDEYQMRKERPLTDKETST